VVERGSWWFRGWLIVFLLICAVALYFWSLGLGFGYQTCDGGRVVEHLPDGTPKRVVGLDCTEPDYWPWRYVQILSYVLAFCAVVVLPYFFSWCDARALERSSGRTDD
jgi:hypothetical protein